MDVVGSQTDFSGEARFKEARPGRPYFGPVYFRKESEPYLTLSVAGGGDAGVTVAEVNLKFIWDVVSQIRIGTTGRAYVVDGRGQLVAHPDISLVLQKTDLSRLEQVQAALAGPATAGAPSREITVAKDSGGRQVLTASARISPSAGGSSLSSRSGKRSRPSTRPHIAPSGSFSAASRSPCWRACYSPGA